LAGSSVYTQYIPENAKAESFSYIIIPTRDTIDHQEVYEIRRGKLAAHRCEIHQILGGEEKCVVRTSKFQNGRKDVRRMDH
jgi:hypothetical protein